MHAVLTDHDRRQCSRDEGLDVNVMVAIDMAGQFARECDKAIELGADLAHQIFLPHLSCRERLADSQFAEQLAVGVSQRVDGDRTQASSFAQVEVQPQRQPSGNGAGSTSGGTGSVDQQRGRGDGASSEKFENARVTRRADAEVVGVDDQAAGWGSDAQGVFHDRPRVLSSGCVRQRCCTD